MSVNTALVSFLESAAWTDKVNANTHKAPKMSVVNENERKIYIKYQEISTSDNEASMLIIEIQEVSVSNGC